MSVQYAKHAAADKTDGNSDTPLRDSEAPGDDGDSRLSDQAGTDDSQTGAALNPSGWLALLRGKLGLESPQTLRETLRLALRSDSGTDGDISAAEREMILRQLQFGTLRVDDIMVPRADIVAIDENASIGELMATFEKAGASRIPLYRETLDDPRGMAHIKDLLGALIEAARSTKSPARKDKATKAEDSLDLSLFDLSKSIASSKLRRPVLYVPPSMPAMNLLIRMQATHIHMALVIDEYGGTDGLATIEDLIEQVVGEIEDEHDDAEEAFLKKDPVHGLIADARMPVEDLETLLGVKLLSADEEEDIDTLGGLIFSLLARVPARGEIVHHPAGIEFEVLDADPRRIKKLKLDTSKLFLPDAQ